MGRPSGIRGSSHSSSRPSGASCALPGNRAKAMAVRASAATICTLVSIHRGSCRWPADRFFRAPVPSECTLIAVESRDTASSHGAKLSRRQDSSYCPQIYFACGSVPNLTRTVYLLRIAALNLPKQQPVRPEDEKTPRGHRRADRAIIQTYTSDLFISHRALLHIDTPRLRTRQMQLAVTNFERHPEVA